MYFRYDQFITETLIYYMQLAMVLYSVISIEYMHYMLQNYVKYIKLYKVYKIS